VPERFWIETLGCPKNEVDSDKLAGSLLADGFEQARVPGDAELVVVNTCAFIEAAREESIESILALAASRRPGSRLVVTGCLAERHGPELAEALPEVDLVAGFGVPVQLRKAPPNGRAPGFDLLELPRRPATAPWAYVKIAEGCDRRCGFCAIPGFRGPQRSRRPEDVIAEVEQLAAGGVQEIVLVAQDLASYGRDRSQSGDRRRAARDGTAGTARARPLIDLFEAVSGLVPRVRLLYLYPSSLDDELITTVATSPVPYFDLSLQHASERLLRRMRRYGSAERFLERIGQIRAAAPGAALRSSFIVGYPGEREEDHDELLALLRSAELDWAGFFAFSREDGTYAAGLDGEVPAGLVAERLRECGELQDSITAARRSALVGETIEVLVDAPRRARSYREAPGIDGIVDVPRRLPAGSFAQVEVTAAAGPDLVARASSACRR
jgi:ribosomal protein S12 methylthiotransferase